MGHSLERQRQAITDKIRELVPESTAIIFFGSRVRGTYSPASDVDVMVLTPEGVELAERRRLQTAVQASFPHVKLDMVFGSERGLLGSLAFDPHPRFWLENAVATYGRTPHVEAYPPFFKDALESHLEIIKSKIGVVQVCSRTMVQAAQGYLRILKELVLFENALRGDYRNTEIWEEVERLVGSRQVQVLRNPRPAQRLRRPAVMRLQRLVRRKWSSVKRQITQMHLPYFYPPRDG